MQYRRLGKTDVEVSAVAMGCWAIVGDFTWGPQEEKDAEEAIQSALDNGVTFFDTAEAYGNGYSEQLLGKSLGDRRRDVTIATKVSQSNLAPKKLRTSCENSLKRLGTDYIDLYQIHWPNHDIPIQDTIGAMEELKEEGKIRIIGCSNFGPQDLSGALSRARFESNQVAYNLLWRGIEFGLRDLCLQNDVSILPYSPIAQGLLTGKFSSPGQVPPQRARTRHFSDKRPHTRHGEEGAEDLTFQTIEKLRRACDRIRIPMVQVALAYLLTCPGVTSVIAGMRNAQQARDNAQAAGLDLPEDLIEELESATSRLKMHFGPSLDLWQSDERMG